MDVMVAAEVGAVLRALALLSGAQQRQRHQLRLHFHHTVQKPTLGGCADRLGFIKRRAPPHRYARRGQGRQRPLNVFLSVSLIRPQGEIGGLGGASHRSLRRCQPAVGAALGRKAFYSVHTARSALAQDKPTTRAGRRYLRDARIR